MNQQKVLSTEEVSYLKGLYEGNAKASELTVYDLNSAGVKTAQTYFADDQENVHNLLAKHKLLRPTPAMLELRLPKERLTRLLRHFDELECLLITNCFGLTKPLDEGGRLVLISRGAFWKASLEDTDESVYKRFYTRQSENGDREYPAYLNLNTDRPLREATAQRYIGHFMNLYKESPEQGAENVHGYLFPIRAMLPMMTTAEAFGHETRLRLRWGLLSFTLPNILGNFSIWVLADKPRQNGFVLEFRERRNFPTDGSSCPPKQPCNPPIDQ